MKIICFGVRDYEINIFKKIEDKEKDISFILKSEYLNDSNYELALGYECIMIRANCVISFNTLNHLKENGLKYLLTRTIGYNHIDLNACKELGIICCNAPGYSPRSIAEVGVGMSLSILRNLFEATYHSSNLDFRLNNAMFGKLISSCTVGILGCGKIGKASALLYKSLGCNVLGYDLYEDLEFKDIITYKSFNEVIKESDIISLHMSYNKDVNYHLLNDDVFSMMKDDVIIINTSRGELIDHTSLIKYIKCGKVKGCGLDVLEEEDKIFFKLNEPTSLSPIHQELISLYPKVLITPHIASSTDDAVEEALNITINNLKDVMKGLKCPNRLV